MFRTRNFISNYKICTIVVVEIEFVFQRETNLYRTVHTFLLIIRTLEHYVSARESQEPLGII